jgi:hypothetical protein
MIYLIYLKNFCKCHNVPPPITTVKINTYIHKYTDKYPPTASEGLSMPTHSQNSDAMGPMVYEASPSKIMNSNSSCSVGICSLKHGLHSKDNITSSFILGI